MKTASIQALKNTQHTTNHYSTTPISICFNPRALITKPSIKMLKYLQKNNIASVFKHTHSDKHNHSLVLN